jgi:hypothetical protein
VGGPCGTSYIYDNPAPAIGVGWIQEYYGINLIYPIIGGGASISWSNARTGGSSDYDQSISKNGAGFWGPNGHNAYTHTGLITSLLDAVAIVQGDGGFCFTPPGEPYSVTNAS